MLEPSGLYYGYSCCTAGKGRQTAKAEFEKHDFSKMTCEEAVYHLAKMYLKIYKVFAFATTKPEIRSGKQRSVGSASKAISSTN